MQRQASLFLLIALLAGCQTPAPVARKIPHVTTVHGERLVDNYYWLRQKDSPDVLTYLQAEDAYTEAQMRKTRPLQDALYQEMLNRIEETDRSVPYRKGEWFYYHRTEQGKQYPIYCRHRTGAEEVILDQNQLATGKDFMAVSGMTVSDNGRYLAFGTDDTGFREYTLQIKDLQTGQMLKDTRTHVDSFAWAKDNQTLFYVTEDDAKRPYRLWRHTLGAANDELIYEEKDALFFLGIGRSRSRAYLFLSSASKTTSEVRYLRVDQPAGEFRVVAPRTKDHEYDVDHAGELFYIRTNDRGRNFRLVTAPVADPQQWTELVPHRPDVMLDGVELFARHYVLVERAGGLPRLRVVNLATRQVRNIEFPDAAYSVAPEDNAEFDTDVFRYGFESLRTPHSICDYDMLTGKSTQLKQQPVKGDFNPSRYQVERLHAKAEDGTLIPVSLVYRRDLRTGNLQPLLLDGYGAYGIPEDVWFSSHRLSLLDRGVIFAIAHVRGGGELGKPWHNAGRMLQKRNTFTDFIAAAELLTREGYTSRDKLIITGGSAGGLLMGAVLNLRPDLFRAALVEVPFVDVINTMLDESLPLTVTEFEEWGNPKIKPEYDYIRSYSPYDNVAATNYPAMLVKTSLNDSQVMYWEPAKYVAKLRALKTDRNALLLKVDLGGAGHGGKSGRYDALHELAFDYAFLFRQWGIAR